MPDPEPGRQQLSQADVDLRLASLDSAWHHQDDRLVRAFTFSSFSAAFGLATRVALLAEAQGHHPDLEVGWGRLVVIFTSHDIGGLSERDFAMATKVDRLVERGLGTKEG